MEQQTKYGTIPAQTSKTASGSPGKYKPPEQKQKEKKDQDKK